MEIKKFVGSLELRFTGEVVPIVSSFRRTTYAVRYKGFVSSGPDLGACIVRCYEAANSN